jgi:hypothetical protein
MFRSLLQQAFDVLLLFILLQVIARNEAHDSNSSAVAALSFDGDAAIEAIEGLVVDHKDNHSVELTWKEVNKADGYYVVPKSLPPYPNLEMNNTAKTNKITGNSISDFNS